MRPERIGVSPLLEEDDAQRILDVAMDRVQQTSRFADRERRTCSRLSASARSMFSGRARTDPVTMSMTRSYDASGMPKASDAAIVATKVFTERELLPIDHRAGDPRS